MMMVLTVHIGYVVGFDYSFGAKGVQLFFILSGFLSMRTLDKELANLNYYINRCKRILPLYWSAILLMNIKNVLIAIVNGEELYFSSWGGWINHLLRYLLGLQCVIPSENWAINNNQGALWTMSSFFFFYAVAPVLKKYCNSYRKSMFLLIGLGSCTPMLIKTIKVLLSQYPVESRIDLFAINNPLTTLYCFVFGSTLFYAIKDNKQFYYCLLLLLFSIITSARLYFYEVLFTVVVCIAYYCNLKSDSMSHHLYAMLRLFSKMSFAVYLIHPIILDVELFIWKGMHINNSAAHTVFIYLMCFVVSYGVYFIIDRIPKALATVK